MSKRPISQLSKSIIDKLLAYPNVSKQLNKLKKHHEDSYQHCIRVGLYSVEIGIANKLEKKDLELLGLAGLLHDLGKCDIELDILAKTSYLDDVERKRIEHHPRIAFINLSGDKFNDVKKIVIAHHEHKNNAYPRSGEDRRTHVRSFKERRAEDLRLKTLAEMLAAADIYDALKEPRSYKKPFSVAKIQDIMLNEYKGNKKYIKQVMNLNIVPV